MTFPVVWLMPDVQRAHNDSRHRLTWAQAQVEEILTAAGGEHLVGFDELPEGATSATVVIPAEYFANQVEWLNIRLNNLDDVVVLVTSDEASRFAVDRLQHRLDRMRVWIQTPRPGQKGERFLPFGPPPDTGRMLAERTGPADVRHLDWFFSGQVNHVRRAQMVDVLQGLPGGGLIPTGGFLQGMERSDYLAMMAHAKVIPCPSGPATPDSFRVWEALEAGCLPVVDAVCPAYAKPGFWELLFGGPPPFPVIDDWAEFPELLGGLLAGWPANANRAQAAWQQYKRSLAARIVDDIWTVNGGESQREEPVLGWRRKVEEAVDRGAGEEDREEDRVDAGVQLRRRGNESVSRGVRPFTTSGEGREVEGEEEEALITVLIPTSPIPSHPATKIVEETVASVRYHLPDAPIVLMCDGVRTEQEDRRADYEEYLKRLLWLSAHEWGNAAPLVFGDHQHQANMTRRALEQVDTPLILFVEHDTPIVTDEPIDWPAITGALLADELDVIRFHHEALILEPHQHLMVDGDVAHINGCPVMRTIQWSQRPHVASADYYRRIITDHFPSTGRTMIEDRMHGVCQDYPWRCNRLAVYAPGANMKRSLHTDGREGDEKFPMVFA